MYLTYYDNENQTQVNFVYSPFHEMIASLHVLSNCQHHLSREKWSDKVLSKFSNKMIQELVEYEDVSTSFLGILSFLEDENLWNMSISECINSIEKIKIIDFLHTLFNGEVKVETIANAVERGYIDNSIEDKYIKIIKRPELFRHRIISFLKEYYYNYFVEEISFSEPLLIRKLKREFDRCKNISIYKYINTLHPRIEVTDDKVNFHKYKLFEYYKKDIEKIVLVVDSFTIPHLLLGCGERSIKLIIPTYITSYDANKMPKDTLSILKSLADETRMQIIKHLYKQPMSTQKLAGELELTEACISKHLKILYKAGIVSKQRDGNYMNYHLNQKVIDSLVLMMYEYIN
ncbi:MAG: metalloregulator ArsR/SmtB family transcription factor [Vallitalea sp.]|jgi:DNA-binding transcriptional ArsR family regulator|nr:metalloregulator ArsR/SmtB family transcription factor [Vallitalea sp.]